MSTYKGKYKSYPGTLFLPGDSYDINNRQLIGRRVAGKAFAEGIITSLNEDENINIIVFSDNEIQQLKKIIEPLGVDLERINFEVGLDNINMKNIENIHIPGPDIDEWSIIRTGQKSNIFSITGVIHTLCSTTIIKGLKEYLTGGLESWDSLVCTSTSGKEVVEKAINFYHESLQRKYETTLSNKKYPKITTIPLAVNDITHDKYLSRKEKRNRARERLEIPRESIVILSLGRLSFHSKSHPLPLYRSIAKITANRPKADIILLECGSFYNENIKNNYDNLIKSIRPLKVKRIGGLTPARENEKIDSLNASDIFVSPSDNIQETFGLSVIEAMAAGLPCVVSNWNGYRDLVKDNENGFLISTTQLKSLDTNIDNIDIDYRIGKIDYDYMIGLKSMSTVVDEDEITSKLLYLCDNPNFREKMGENSRKRWKEYFSWSIVSNQYRDLWAELKIRRLNAGEVATKYPHYPSFNYLFKGYSNNKFERAKLSRTIDCCPPEILNYPLHREFTNKILGNKIQKLIEFINNNNSISIEDLINLEIPEQKCQEIMAILEKLGIAKKVT